MTDEKGKSEAAPIDAADLDLVASMADAGKSEEDIWDEFEDADKATSQAEPDEAAPESVEPAQEDGDTAGVPEAPQDSRAKQQESSDDDVTMQAQEASDDGSDPDIWDGASEEQRAAYDALRRDNEKLVQKARSAEGRVPGLQRRVDQLLKELGKKGSRSPAVNVRGELAHLDEDYPEIAKPVLSALEQVENRINEVDANEVERRQDAEAELVAIVQEETAKVETVHPEYEKFLAEHGQAFTEWVEDQPAEMRRAAYLNAEFIRDGDAANRVIGAFKQHLNPTPANAPAKEETPSKQQQPLNDRRKRQLSATAAPGKTDGRPTVSGIPEDGDPEAIWKSFDALDAQKERSAYR